MQLTNRAVLADVLYPRDWTKTREARIAKEAVLIIGFAAFVALCAQVIVRLPFTTVPITGQTFAALVAGGTLGAWRGGASLLVYLMAGMFLPVYAPSSPSGVVGESSVHFIFPWNGTAALPWDLSSGGYILGFVLAAAAAGYFAQKGWDRKPWLIGGFLVSNALIYVPGLLWLSYRVATEWIHPAAGRPLGELITGTGTWEKTLVGGLYPFILGDLMKLYLATMTLPLAWKLVERFRKDVEK